MRESPLRSGEPYTVVLAPSGHRLHPPLQGLRSHHFQFRKAEYRIAYRIREEKRQVELVLVKSRERFYEILARLIRRR